jgi:hypothetical protein
MAPATVATNQAIKRRPPMSRFTRTLFGCVIADAALVLFLTFGYVFPSRISVHDPDQAMPEAYYDYSAKISPVEAAKPVRAKRRIAQAIPLISARTMPLAEARPQPTSADAMAN